MQFSIPCGYTTAYAILWLFVKPLIEATKQRAVGRKGGRRKFGFEARVSLWTKLAARKLSKVKLMCFVEIHPRAAPFPRSLTRCPVQGLITPIPIGYSHMCRSRRELFRAGKSTLSCTQCTVMGIQNHFPDGIIKSVHFCKVPSHFWEIAPCFSFLLVVVELLFHPINATLKPGDWEGYLLYILQNA